MSYPAGTELFIVNNRKTRLIFCNLFKVINKDNRMTLMTSFWCFYSFYSTYCSGAAILDFKQVNAGCAGDK